MPPSSGGGNGAANRPDDLTIHPADRMEKIAYFVFMKIVYTVLGSLTLALGILGIFLPLLPTTPFLLLSAWCYCRSSDRLYGWLMGHHVLGGYIRNYRDKRAITPAGKAVSLALLWITLCYCIFAVTDRLWLQLLLGAVLIGVTLHILSFRTLRRSENLHILPTDTPARKARRDALLARLRKEQSLPPDFVPAANHDSFLLRAEGKDVGCAFFRRQPEGRLAVEGIFLRREARGRGYARETFAFAEYLCKRHGLHTLCATIDGRNGRGVAVYAKSGFLITATLTDGNTTRYVMERTVQP